jgi:hypothetical protein
MESMYDNTLRLNQAYAKKDGYTLVHFFITKDYGTMSGNRVSIGTVIYQAIKKDGSDTLFNKVQLEEFSTDLIRNYKPTKSTKDTHQKKFDKIVVSKYPNIIEVSDNV